jgi:hypothetical protein
VTLKKHFRMQFFIDSLNLQSGKSTCVSEPFSGTYVSMMQKTP